MAATWAITISIFGGSFLSGNCMWRIVIAECGFQAVSFICGQVADGKFIEMLERSGDNVICVCYYIIWKWKSLQDCRSVGDAKENPINSSCPATTNNLSSKSIVACLQLTRSNSGFLWPILNTKHPLMCVCRLKTVPFRWAFAFNENVHTFEVRDTQKRGDLLTLDWQTEEAHRRAHKQQLPQRRARRKCDDHGRPWNLVNNNDALIYLRSDDSRQRRISKPTKYGNEQ